MKMENKYTALNMDILFKKAPEKFWNLIASRYAASPISDRAAYENKIQKIKTFLSPEDIVLDVGCGTGTQCGDLAGSVKHVTGIDISNKLLAIAEQRKAERKLENVEFIRASFLDEKFQEESFSLVMAFYVLHFFEDIDAVVARVYRLLKPGGMFICETACLGGKNKLAGRFMRFAGRLGLIPEVNLLTNEKLDQALNRAGFELVERTRFSQSNAEYTYFAKKAKIKGA